MQHDWQQIISSHGAAVWRTLCCLVGNDADVRDCYQTVFLEAFQYSRKHTVDDWARLLTRIARMRAIDQLRQQYRRAQCIDASADPADAICQIPTPLEQAQAVELADQLRVCLALLTPQQAEIFVMRFVEQLSYDEIAARTGSNRNAVGVMLNRVRRRLRIQLEDNRNTSTNREAPS